MSVSLRKQRDKPSENRIFKKENKYGNLSIIHHSQRLPKRHFSDGLGGGNFVTIDDSVHFFMYRSQLFCDDFWLFLD